MTLSGAEADGRPAHTIEIPSDLYRQLRTILEGSRFGSVDDFALHVLRDLASHPSRAGLKGGTQDPAGNQEEPLTREEIEIIQERLQNLGYL